MQFEDSYFEEEVIDGFYVPSMMKKCWAAHLVVLNDLDTVCRKYEIKYFADWGTLLGCVRNAGQIPWDDDFDVCMKRDDYQQFLKIWEKELGEKYELKCLQTQPEREDFLAKLVNVSEFCGDFTKVDQFAGFPYGMGVDIFVLDYIAPDEKEDERLCRLYNDTAILAYKYKSKMLNEDEFRKELSDIEKRTKKTIDCTKNIYNELNILADSIYSEIPEESAKEITQMHIYTNKRLYRIPKQCYADSIYMIFEGMQIPVPIGYEEILRRKYGNYIIPVKKGGSHEYPFYDEQEKWVLNAIGKKIGGYVFGECKTELIGRNNINSQLISAVDGLASMHGILRNTMVNNEQVVSNELQSEGMMEVLTTCQNLAIKVGDYIEKSYGNGCYAVKKLEEYCESVYEFTQNQNVDILDYEIEEIKKEILTLKKGINEVIVIPYRDKYFDGLKSIIDEYKKIGANVSVMPIPYYVKNFSGIITAEYEPIAACENIKQMGYAVLNYEEYDLVSKHPNVIVIQNPFDGTNFSTTVAPMFYSEQLKKYCDELIYVSPFDVDITSERARKMCRDFINRPAVIYSDKIVVQNEEIKKLYIESLIEFSGNEYEAIWREKVVVVNSPQKLIKENKKKKILYFVSFGVVFAYSKNIIAKMQKSIEILEKYSDKIDWILAIDEAIVDNTSLIEEKTWNGIKEIIEDTNKKVSIVNPQEYMKYVNEYDAYFGDSGVLSNMFRFEKKPVMIENLSL